VITILLTGREGQVGWELQQALKPLGKIVAVDRQSMDLNSLDSVRQVIRDIQPSLIVNAAAYTAVDRAESEAEIAMTVNGMAPGVMAEEAKRINAGIIHYSTDYVFDGRANRPYVEQDGPNPLNVYGKTKLAGEHAIRDVGVPHLILRTSWVYGLRGKNFLLTIRKLATERDALSIVADQHGAPTWCRTIAELTASIVGALFPSKNPQKISFADVSGIYHATASGSTSWHGFAQKILELSPDFKKRGIPKLTPIDTVQYPLPAQRPKNSCLSTEKIRRTFGVTLPTWDKSLMTCLKNISN